MTDSTIHLTIEKGRAPAISVRDLVGMEDDGRADIGIDLPELHFSIIMPKRALKELVEKAQEFLGKKEAEVQNQAESEEVTGHVK